jgi:hypothetical protein
MFLNPSLLEIIEYAYRRKVSLTADVGVNLNYVAEKVLEGLVKFQFRSIRCSIDGASDNTYKVYRVNGNYETVIDNIKKINYFKKKYSSEYPYLYWQFVIFGHNEHELPLASRKAAELGMRFQPKLSWDEEFSPIQKQEFVKKEIKLNIISRRQYKEIHGVDYKHGICNDLWDEPQINWDGKILGCCRNFWRDFGGNAFEVGLLAALNDEKIRYARDMVSGEKGAREDIPCNTCDIYLTMKANNNFLKRGLTATLRPIIRAVYYSCKLHRLRPWLH